MSSLRGCLLFLLVFIALAAGCGGRYENAPLTGLKAEAAKIRLAVIPFQGVPEMPGSGLIVADSLANQLLAHGYSVMAPEEVAQRLASREGEALAPQEIGRIVGTPYILAGRVTEYTYKAGVGENPAVGVNARLIDAATGKVVWSAMRAYWQQEDSLSRLTAITCQRLVQAINAYFGISGNAPE